MGDHFHTMNRCCIEVKLVPLRLLQGPCCGNFRKFTLFVSPRGTVGMENLSKASNIVQEKYILYGVTDFTQKGITPYGNQGLLVTFFLKTGHLPPLRFDMASAV